MSKNLNLKIGEIDILCRDGKDVVTVEVKTRRKSPYAARAIFDTITPAKRARLKRLAEIAARRYHSRNYRVDLLGVVIDREGDAVSIEYIKSAF